MAYKYIPNEKLDKDDFKTSLLLSDGKRWHKVSPGIVTTNHEFIKQELDNMAIRSDKTLLILNPQFFQDMLYSNLYLECQVSLINKDNTTKEQSIGVEKTKIRSPYSNKHYAQYSMKKRNKVCKMGQVFVFDSIEKLRSSCHEIVFLWTVRTKEDDTFVYGTKTIVRPKFETKYGTDSNWFYLKNIDAWFSEEKDENNHWFNFPIYQGKKVKMPHYNSEKTEQGENWMEDIEEIQIQELSLSLFSDDSFWDI
ncbi:hypothetical protein [Lactococcus sp. dk322]|uniref:hypothetical protein n=1 Tax=Lactococcus sp. dk322 TaxID=2603290 RepID=UPI0011C8403D|nr:hypothetical protein [Lactococcus sp. dk322]TXK46779.1 hypothetical protein FVP43_10815 [Lactococcus sp. dk322]